MSTRRKLAAGTEIDWPDNPKKIILQLSAGRGDVGLPTLTDLDSSQLAYFFFDTNPLPVWIYTAASQQFLAVNPAAIKNYGYTREEFLAMTLRQIASEKETSEQSHPASPSLQHLCKDGSVKLVQVYTQPIFWFGEDACLETLVDMTQIEKAEARLHSVLTNVQCLLWDAWVEYDEQADEMLWILEMSDEHAAERWLPVAQEPGQSYSDAWYWARNPEHRERTDEFSAQAILSGQSSYQQDYACMLADGSNRWLFEEVQISSQGPGKWHLVGVTTDITSYKEAEEALRHSEARKAAILSSSMECIVTIDRMGCVVEWNPAAEQTFGYTREEAVGQDIAALIIPESQRTDYRTGHAHYLETGEGPIFNKRSTTTACRADGLEFPIEMTVVATQAEQMLFTAFIHDITEQQQAKDALVREHDLLRTLIDHLPDSIYVKDRKSRFVLNNAAHSQTIGLSSQEEMFGKTDFDYFPRDDAAMMYQAEQHIMETGQPLLDFEELPMIINGQQTWHNSTKVPLRDVQGQITGLVGISRNVTRQREMETEREALLAQANTLLAEALEKAERDPLTGLFNHRRFHQEMRLQCEGAQLQDYPLSVLLLDIDNFQFFNALYGHIAGDELLRQSAKLLAQEAKQRLLPYPARFSSDEFAVLLPHVSLADALVIGQQIAESFSAQRIFPTGTEISVPLTVSFGVASLQEDGTEHREMLTAAENRLRLAKGGTEQDPEAARLRDSLLNSAGGFSMLDALVTAVDVKDRYTRRHSEDVMRYAVALARKVQLGAEAVREIAVAALLHDVGKIGVPDFILRKPGKLTEEEYEAIKQHALMGAILVESTLGFTDEVLAAIRHHHERWDGRGYPFGLRGDSSPIMARILAVADTYSALTTDRPYRKGSSPMRAREILEAGAGTQWDPVLIDAFLPLIDASFCQND